LLKETVHWLDDFDGSEGAQSVEFSLDGADYEIDLSIAHRLELNRTLQRYIDAARPVAATKSNKRPRNKETRDLDADIRAWAKADGRWPYLNDRGRLPRAVTDAYNEEAGYEVPRTH
jgi:hypothetical protein